LKIIFLKKGVLRLNNGTVITNELAIKKPYKPRNLCEALFVMGLGQLRKQYVPWPDLEPTCP